MGSIKCCVCGKHIRDDPQLKPGEVSHGYCPSCYKKAMRALDEMIEEMIEERTKEKENDSKG